VIQIDIQQLPSAGNTLRGWLAPRRRGCHDSVGPIGCKADGSKAGNEGKGNQIFVDELARFAAGAADPRVTAIAERAAAPLRVAVHGRRGVGCSTVARALGLQSGLVVTPAAAADLDVYVIAEVVKPEDCDVVAAARRPLLVVLNKADLGGGSPASCVHFSALLQAPVEPMVGLLAVAALGEPGGGPDEDLWEALRALAAHPGGSAALDGSFDGFLAASLPVPIEARLRLLETLDLFGTALGVAAMQRHRTAAQVRGLWRRVSRVDAVVDRLVAVGAEVRYRRVLDAVAELEAQGVSHEGISDFLTCDDTVVARMAAAVELAEAAGLAVGPVEPLPRAVHWERQGRAALSELRRACARDITRGSLRLWSRAGGAVGESS
jgi:hypothetical protein